MSAGGSQAASPRAHSFGVRVNRASTGEMTFHEWPISESRARWRASLLVDMTRIVTIETFDPHDGYRLIHEEVTR